MISRSRLWSKIEKKYVGSYSAGIYKDPCNGQLYYYGTNVTDDYLEEDYTGLKDIENNELFINDVILVKDAPFVIKYRESYCDITLHTLDTNWRFINLTKANITKHKLKVINNIHDFNANQEDQFAVARTYHGE